MRKHICFVLATVMLLCAIVGASPSTTAASAPEGAIYQMQDSGSMTADANDNPYVQQYEIVFAPVRGTRSEKEIGLMHLRAAKTPDYIIDSFTDEEIAEFAQATKAVISVSYYTETFDEVSGESSMVNISYEDFRQLELVDVGEEEEYFPALIQSEGEQGAETTPTKGAYNSNGGLLKIARTMYQIPNRLSGYRMLANFEWSKMPSYRGTDLLTITRDTGTVEVPNFKGYLQYSERRRIYNSFGGRIIFSTGYYTHTARPANDDNTNSGFGIRYKVPFDVPPPISMFPNQIRTARQYSNLKGYVCYDGYLRYPSIVPQYFNNWITYLHQKGSKIGLGFSFSVEYPKGAAINIDPRFTKQFDRMNETVLALWTNK